MIIDTHCHLIDEAFQSDVDEVVNNAIKAGVEKMILACCDEKESSQIFDICTKYPKCLYPTVGIHPENLGEDIHKQYKQLFENLVPFFKQEYGLSPIAIGEVGLDLHWDTTRLDDQIWLLKAQVNWAIDHDLPILFHIRDAMSEFLDLCRNTLINNAREKNSRIRGILHCYSGTSEQADEALQYGDFLFGIGGTLTYKKSHIPEIARHVGLSRIVLETDAPYLAPVPHRGKRNEPQYTAVTARSLSEILGRTYEEVIDQTTSNARQMFGI